MCHAALHAQPKNPSRAHHKHSSITRRATMRTQIEGCPVPQPVVPRFKHQVEGGAVLPPAAQFKIWQGSGASRRSSRWYSACIGRRETCQYTKGCC
eukprot:scaffold178031_cov28-Tisochrysis_lutea.AAC.1